MVSRSLLMGSMTSAPSCRAGHFVMFSDPEMKSFCTSTISNTLLGLVQIFIQRFQQTYELKFQITTLFYIVLHLKMKIKFIEIC